MGETSSAPFTIAPTANAGGPYSVSSGAAIAVSGAGSVAPTGSLTRYSWRWGDGSSDTASSLSSASHTYAATGSFTVTLTVTDNAGATASATTTATVTAPQVPLPAPWLTQDIGGVGLSGSTSYSSGRFTVAGAGADIWDTADSFRYVYQPLNGNGQIVARVTSLQNTHAFAKAGVMIRESLSANAPNALVSVRPGGIIDLVARSSAGVSTINTGSTTQALPIWLKLVRTANTIVASVSADGSTWSVVATTTVTMTSNVLVGLAVMSHDTTVLNTSVLDNVTVTAGTSTQPPATPSSPTPTSSATGVALNSSVNWTAAGATSYDVSFGTANPPPQVATNLATAAYTPSSLVGGTVYFWRIVARNAAGTSTGPVWSFTTASVTQPPATPGSPTPATGVTGVAVNSGLTWTAAGATAYDVSFGTANPPPQVATNLATASYTPSSLVAGTVYFWRVVARNTTGTSTGPVWSFTTAPGSSGTVPAPWLSQDIGSVGPAGSSSYSSGQFTIAGAGGDIWNSADAFRYVYQPLNGDGQIVARVTSIMNTHTYAKAGVMIRESLNASAPNVIVDLRPEGGIEMLARPTAGATTFQVSASTQPPPTWLKLVRTGNSIVASISANGSTWSVVGTTSVTMTSNVLVGLAVTSHDTTVLNTSTLDSVTVTTPAQTQPPAAPGSPTPANSATGVAANSGLTWSATGATSYDVSVGTANPPPQVATNLSTASYTPGSLVGGTVYFWRVVARNSAGTSTGPVWSFTTAPAAGGAVPAPWLSQDIGSVGPTGSASYSSGQFTIAGAGADIWNTGDAFRYVYQPLNGDGQIVARVTSIMNTNTYAKAGVMIRESLNASASHAIVDLRPGGAIEFLARSTTGASTVQVGGAVQSPPTWLKLVRAGSSIAAYVSANGSTWTQAGSTSVALGSTAYIGLAVTSHDASVLNTATFDSVTVTNGGGAPPPPASNGDVVIYASSIPAAARHGSWQVASDPLSPNGVKLTTPDNGVSNTSAALATPTDYVDVTFNAVANTPYRLWLRMRATGNSKWNDSLWVQFSDAVVSGSPTFRMNTTSALIVNLATSSSGSSLLDWGWQNTAYWLSQPTTVTFPTTGVHTIRIQVREDGIQFDQIVLSPGRYLNAPPGPISGDSTVVPTQ